MKRSRIVLLSLIVLVVVVVLALPAFARADSGTSGWTA